MSKARQLADLLDSSNDVVSGALDNIPTSPADWNTIANKPTLAASATTDTTNMSNISSGVFPRSRLGSGTHNSSTFLRGDRQFITNCANYPNCNSSNCICACVCNC